MLDAHEIKKEEPSSKCTCKKNIQHSQGGKQVLVHFGLSRKKVFVLNGKISLLDLFKSYVLNEPAFSRLLDDSYVVFQEYNKKFGTWVDVDQKDDFEDGAELTAVFFPKNIECDDTNPGSIRKRGKAKSQVSDNKNVIEIVLSDDDRVQSINEDNKNECHRKQKKKKNHEECKTSSEDETSQINGQLQKEVLNSKTKRKSSHEVSSNEPNKKREMTSNTPANPPAQNEENSVPESSFGSSNFDSHQTNKSYGSSIAECTQDKYSTQNRFTENEFQRSSRFEHPNVSYVLELEKLCSNRRWPKPIYDIQPNSQGFVCKLLVNNKVSLYRAADGYKVKEIAAEKALRNLKSLHTNTTYRQQGKPYYNGPSYRPYTY